MMKEYLEKFNKVQGHNVAAVIKGNQLKYYFNGDEIWLNANKANKIKNFMFSIVYENNFADALDGYIDREELEDYLGISNLCYGEYPTYGDFYLFVVEKIGSFKTNEIFKSLGIEGFLLTVDEKANKVVFDDYGIKILKGYL